MKYMMLNYGSEETWNNMALDEVAALIGQIEAYNEALRESGELVSFEALVSHPRSLQWEAGDVLVTEGPYGATKELIGSCFIVDVADEERAMEIARSYPGLPLGSGLELWPVMSGRSRLDHLPSPPIPAGPDNS